MRQAAVTRLTRWSSRRHGIDALPLTVHRRRIYIVPTRFGMALGLLLIAMLLAGLNYNSNLGLAFGFLMVSLALVAMHHCHRNLLGLRVDAVREVDAFAGGGAVIEFALRNDAAVERCDIEVLCGGGSALVARVPAGSYETVPVALPTVARGILELPRFEVRTRFPFGWFRAWTYVQSPLAVFVAPQPGGAAALPAARGNAGMTYAEVRGDEEYSSLRAYEPGVPLKHMAWKVLARGGAPAVRVYTGAAAHPEWLDWAALGSLDPEARLRQLCRWVLECERARCLYGLRLPESVIAPARGSAHRTACLRALAAHPVRRP